MLLGSFRNYFVHDSFHRLGSSFPNLKNQFYSHRRFIDRNLLLTNKLVTQVLHLWGEYRHLLLLDLDAILENKAIDVKEFKSKVMNSYEKVHETLMAT
jgi:hypothetical protein